MGSREVARRDVTTKAVESVNESRVLQYLGININDPRAQATLLIAQKYELDPLLKHVQLIQHGPYITRDGYLHIAHKSGVFDGLEVLEETETPTHYRAKVAVYRKDIARPFIMSARYPKKAPGSQADPEDMALVRAMRRALKMAFDVAVPGLTEMGDDVDLYSEHKGDPVVPSPPVLPVEEGPGQAAVTAVEAKTVTQRPGPVPTVVEESTEVTPPMPPLPGDEPFPDPSADEAAEMESQAAARVFQTFAGATEVPGVEETGEVADDVTLARLRKKLDRLDEEQKAALANEWGRAGLRSIKDGARKRLLHSEVTRADNLLEQALEAQADVYDRRRKHILASLSEIGVKDDTARHLFIESATDGEAKSSKALLGRHVKQINDVIDAIRLEQGGAEPE
jgi:hypothetical protein